ncbi:MAG: right-handed parallel beta-helix repeat-containing protein [Fermentimonas sp.]|nr:right-handed parallel beta-helix repeat-containing protein [Fermentimonas sp.]
MNQVGEGEKYEGLHLAAGTYLIDVPDTINPYAILGINDSSKVYGDLISGKPATIFKLMNNAPIDPFKCGMPIIGSMSQLGQDIEFFNIGFDGNNPIGNGANQAPSTQATCSGTKGASGKNYGKGFHDFAGAYTNALKNCSFHHISVTNSAGDGFRTMKWKQSSGLKIYDWNITNCGHCGVMLENTIASEIRNINVTTRSNGAVRTQNGCSDLLIDNVHAMGTSNNYDAGLKLTGDNITVTNCFVHDTYGPGIEFAGENNTGIRIRRNRVVNCGIFPAANGVTGMAGVLINGADALIDENVIIKCRGNGIAVNIYSADGKGFTKSGFKITTRNNVISDTGIENYGSVSGKSGKSIANWLSDTHTVTSEGDILYPRSNYSYMVGFGADTLPEASLEIQDMIRAGPGVVIPCDSEDAANELAKAISGAGLLGNKKYVVSVLDN